MNENRCASCPDEDTDACEDCGKEPEEMKLTYIFYIKDGICEIDGLHNDLDGIVEALGFEVLKSRLDSGEEITEHNYTEGVGIDANVDV